MYETTIRHLEDVASIQYGYPFNSKLFGKTGQIRVVRIRDIKGTLEPTFYSGDYEKEHEVSNGDILVGMDGEFNCTVWDAGRAALNQRMAKVVPNPHLVDKHYLFYLLKTKLKLLEAQITGSTVKHLLDPQLRSTEIPLPPLAIQERIGNLIDRADKLKRIREEANQLTSKVIQSVFLKMFGEPSTNTMNWETAELRDLIYDIRYGTSVRCSSVTNGGVPVLRIPNVIRGTIDPTNLKYAALSEADLHRFDLKDGDLLFVRTNGNREYVGRCAVFHEMNRVYSFASYLIRVRLRGDLLNPDFASLQLSFPAMRSQLFLRARTSAGQYNINTEGIKSIRMMVPPLSLQNRFVPSLHSYEKLIAKQDQSTAEINGLFQSLMHKAFRGELQLGIEEQKYSRVSLPKESDKPGQPTLTDYAHSSESNTVPLEKQ